jgi:hypothetical protein
MTEKININDIIKKRNFNLRFIRTTYNQYTFYLGNDNERFKIFIKNPLNKELKEIEVTYYVISNQNFAFSVFNSSALVRFDNLKNIIAYPNLENYNIEALTLEEICNGVYLKFIDYISNTNTLQFNGIGNVIKNHFIFGLSE